MNDPLASYPQKRAKRRKSIAGRYSKRRKAKSVARRKVPALLARTCAGKITLTFQQEVVTESSPPHRGASLRRDGIEVQSGKPMP